MIAVIVAGGSGTRLWPLSTPDYPKHLLKLSGHSLTLLQHSYYRAKRIADTVYVVSEASHCEHVKAQLPELADDQFIIEPARRGTAHCISLALTIINGRHDANQPIAFMPADHYIRDSDGFVHSFKIAEKVTTARRQLVLVGIEPDYAATGFGYIEKGQPLDDEELVFNVVSFQEKPKHQLARRYVRSGNYLWNGGYFVGSVATFSAAMQRSAASLYQQFRQLRDTPLAERDELYRGFEPAAIDYELLEHVDNLLVVPAFFDWMDLGSYSDLAKAIGNDEQGNFTEGNVVIEEVKNTFVNNKEAKPVVVIGLDNAVVINTPQGILVTRKDLAQKVGDVTKLL